MTGYCIIAIIFKIAPTAPGELYDTTTYADHCRVALYLPDTVELSDRQFCIIKSPTVEDSFLHR